MRALMLLAFAALSLTLTACANEKAPAPVGSPIQLGPKELGPKDGTPPIKERGRTIEVSRVPYPTQIETAAATPATPPGGWHPWYTKRHNVTSAEFSVAIAANDGRLFRVTSEELARQIGNLGLPAPSTAFGLSEWIDPSKNKDIRIIDCADNVLRKKYMSRVDSTGKIFDMRWKREHCAPGEKFLAYKGNPFISLFCGNILTDIPEEKPRVTQVAATTQIIQGCDSSTRTVTVHVWSRSLMTPDQRFLTDMAIEASKKRSLTEEGFKTADSFSRSVGGKLRNSQTRHFGDAPSTVKVSYIETQYGKVFWEMPVADLVTVEGVASREFSINEIAGKTLRFVFSDEDVLSPAMSQVGKREIRLFWDEWGRNCAMNVHAVRP